MRDAVRSAVAPLYLLACLLLGGSAQGIWQNMILQLLGLVIIAWAAAAPQTHSPPNAARQLLFLTIAGLTVAVLQLIPLPPAVWNHGPRRALFDGYQVLGRPAPWLPISLTPYDSSAALLCLIPPLAMFCAVVRLKAFRPRWLVFALIAGASAGIILGALQTAEAGTSSRWYLYPQSSFGLGVGFFANANHMASLLVITLPFIAALAAEAKNMNVHAYSATAAALASLCLLLLVGIGLNHSLAAYLLVGPVAAASVLIVLPARSRWRSSITSVAALAVLLAVAGLATSSIGAGKIGQVATGSVESRAAIFRTTAKAIGDFMPFGSGLGSFVHVYRLYESPQTVTTEYVVHAHNDFAELVLELGFAGIILLLLFLGWWGRAVRSVWRKGEGNPFARAASIASGAILIHSLVDFPLRTAAISVCFAMCLAFLVDWRRPPRRDPEDLRPARHLVFI